MAEHIQHRVCQRVCFTGISQDPPLSDPPMSDVLDVQQYQKNTVCIVENICPEWVEGLRDAWKIDQSFFDGHRDSHDLNEYSLWDNVMDSELPWQKRADAVRANLQLEQHLSRRQYHIKGVLHHLKLSKDQQPSRANRHFELSPLYGWQSHSRTSYYRVSKHLCIPIPQMYADNKFSLYDCLQDCFRHTWELDVLFSGIGEAEAVNFICLSYFVLSSLWLTNLRHLNTEIKKISFNNLRKPTVETNERLHDLRRDLDTLRSEVKMAKTYLLPDIVKECSQLLPYRNPKHTLEEVYSDSADLERFLMDTFQLLMSSISVIDAETSIEDERRSSLLTQLATIYVPLSFVTGVFGMNVKEINDSPRSIWIFVVALVVVGMFTVALLSLERHIQNQGGWWSVLHTWYCSVAQHIWHRKGPQTVDVAQTNDVKREEV